jgi:hypothetical protein
MATPCESAKQSSVLNCFHQSALRHFERAHMIACDLNIAQSSPVAVQSANDTNERCKQWVLNESGQCPSEVASWDGSVNYDSNEGNGRLDSCSAYAGLLDSCRSGHDIIPIKALPVLESWNSSRSTSMCHVQICAKPELLTSSPGVHVTEAPRSLSISKTQLEI